MYPIAIFLALLLYYSSASPVTDGVTCTSVCKAVDDDKINVHLVPHSHDDVGWVSTVDEYYKGSGKFVDSAHAGVKYILDSTLKALKDHPDRSYVQVESAFFYRWWKEQSDANRKAFVDLVNKGQIEMLNGAWSMNDEADTNYQSIIDQFTWGLRILNKTVGDCGRPSVGWQIDPFGHSREHASLITQMGFKTLVLGRIDHTDKESRKTDQALDFTWTSSDTLSKSDIFTTIFPNFYTYEEDFCFDVLCSNSISDDAETKKKQIENFQKILDTYKTYYQTKNILIPMGGDFNYQKAEQNYLNTDKLIDGFKDNSIYRLIYSTPSCYRTAVEAALKKENKVLPLKTTDFFPYSSDDHSFWAGYFTSRPTVKRFERVGNNILQSAKQLATFSRIDGNDFDKYTINLRRTMGVMQHHDAVTGTEKQKVANDYVRRLHEAIRRVEEPMGRIVTNLLKKNDTKAPDLKLSSCLLANVSICTVSGKDKFVVVVQNPLSRPVNHYVRLPVNATKFNITGPSGEVTKYNVFDAIQDFAYVKEKEHPLPKELIFKAEAVPAMGINLYYVEKLDGTDGKYYPYVAATEKSLGDVQGVEWDDKNKISGITVNSEKLAVSQDFLFYDGQGANCGENTARCSGAYIFRPTGDASIVADSATIEVAKGNIVQSIRQKFSDEVMQVIRLYEDENYIEFDWLVGNLQNTDNKGKEVITRFTVTETDFKSGTEFYTDSNGRQLITRTRSNNANEPIASNYYPVTSRLVIRDTTQKIELAVLNDRAQGGSSLKENTMELMLHRRLYKDDGFGVDEALNEVEYDKGLYARGQYYLTFGTTELKPDTKSTAVYERQIANEKLLSPWVLLGEIESLDNYTAAFNQQFTGLKDPLPLGLNIMTLEPWMDSYILRLENIFDKNDDDGSIAKPQQIKLMSIFTNFNVVSYAETLLGVNFVNKTEQLDWKPVDKATEITINQMEIKTFLITTDKNNKGGYEDDDPRKSSAQALSGTFLVLVVALYALF